MKQLLIGIVLGIILTSSYSTAMGWAIGWVVKYNGIVVCHDPYIWDILKIVECQ